MRKTWYGVYAENGLGIYTNYNRLMHNSMYTRGEHIKKFATQEEAEDYAISGFTALNGSDALLVTIPASNELWINYFYNKMSIVEPEYPEIAEGNKGTENAKETDMKNTEAVEEKRNKQ